VFVLQWDSDHEDFGRCERGLTEKASFAFKHLWCVQVERKNAALKLAGLEKPSETSPSRGMVGGAFQSSTTFPTR